MDYIIVLNSNGVNSNEMVPNFKEGDLFMFQTPTE